MVVRRVRSAWPELGGAHSDVDETAPGWYPDPSGRHQRRYWTGVRWSRHVEDGDVRSVDLAPEALTDPAPPDPTPGRGRRNVLVLAVGAILLAGVGAAVVVAGSARDDGGTDVPETTELTRRDQYVRHLSDYVYEVGGVGTIGPTQSDCVAERIVDGVGVDRLEAMDILNTLEDASQTPLVVGDEAQATYEDAFECLDDRELLAFLGGTIERSTDVGPEQAGCMVQGWLEGMGRDALVDMYTVLSTEGVTTESLDRLPPEHRDLLLDVARTCATPPPTTP